MENAEKLIKIYDENYEIIGSGYLLNMNSNMIKIKGEDLPVLKSKSNITIEIFNEFSGISPYFCEVSIASKNQLNVMVVRKEPVYERRRSLKVRTDISFYIEALIRNNEDITVNVPNMKINILNLSISGMLISSNYDLMINDEITFIFKYANYQAIMLKSKVIRIDNIIDNFTKELTVVNYGCIFKKMPNRDEAIMTRYLFDRQLQLYKNR